MYLPALWATLRHHHHPCHSPPTNSPTPPPYTHLLCIRRAPMSTQSQSTTTAILLSIFLTIAVVAGILIAWYHGFFCFTSRREWRERRAPTREWGVRGAWKSAGERDNGWDAGRGRGFGYGYGYGSGGLAGVARPGRVYSPGGRGLWRGSY
ncbi:hypothetical protein HOY82DRAFT_406434 [Tuber indicum]|nr:hypothetical protein HOY82DRAFT_406434 [Tuber indicum]